MKRFNVLATACFAGLLIFSFTQLSSCNCGEGNKQPQVRNVIIMIGDGMGVGQVSLLMLSNGFEPVEMEKAHSVGLVKTYSANNRVTDSAAAGTALATGTKTNNSRVGMDPEGNPLTSIMTKARDAGMRTGFVVTSPVTDATPAAFYAQVENRRQYEDISAQLAGSGIDVFMGGGRRYFDSRKDSLDLTEKLRSDGYIVAESLDELADTNSGKVACLIHENYPPRQMEGRGDYLPQAVTKTLDILSNNTRDGKGFLLMVEGSQIDGVCHRHLTDQVLCEMEDFDKAVGIAFDYADRNPGTLVIVLADHETGGLSLVPGDANFERAESGVSANYGTGGHSAALIPMFAYGPGAQEFTGVFENTDIPKIIEALLLQ